MLTPPVARRRSAAVWTIATATIVATAACSNLDDDVVPDVIRVQLAVDRTAPAALATVDVSLRLTAGSDARRAIELWDVWVVGRYASGTLALALPEGSLDFAPDQERVVDLVNVGTTNADLVPMCHHVVDVYANIRYLDDPTRGFADVDPPRVTIDCN